MPIYDYDPTGQTSGKFIANFGKISSKQEAMKIPLSPPFLEQILPKVADKLPPILGQGPLVKGRYLHWDQVRHRTPPAPPHQTLFALE